MKNHRDNLRKAGAAIAALMALAALALLSLFGGHPQPAVLAQFAPTQTSVPSPPFTSPLRPPTPTATRRPRPTPVSMQPITDATVIAALRARYRGILDIEPPTDAPPRSPLVASPTAPVRGYLPLILSGPAWKGVGDAAYSDVGALNVSWWYDWQHWKLDSGAFATALPGRLDRYVPMIRCANRPEDGMLGDTGVLSAPWNPPVIATRAAMHPGRVWLVFNEPDFPMLSLAVTPTPSGPVTHVFFYDQCAKYLCNMLGRTPLPPGIAPTAGPTPTPVLPCSVVSTSTATPTWVPGQRAEMARLAADRYVEIYTTIKQADLRAKVFCCGNFYTADTPWWRAFLDRLEYHRTHGHPNLALDGVHIHTYPYSSSTDCYPPTINGIWTDCLKQKIEEYLIVHQSEPLTRNKPLWITEYGSLTNNVSADEVAAFLMRPMAGWIGSDGNKLDTGEWGVDGVAWFVTGYGDVTANTWLLEMTATPTWPPSPTPSPTRINMYTGTPASTPRVPLGAQWATYPADRFPSTSTPGP